MTARRTRLVPRSPAREAPAAPRTKRAGQGHQRKRFRAPRRAAASPAGQAPSSTQKRLHDQRVSRRFLPSAENDLTRCVGGILRMGTHAFIIPLLRRFVNVTSGLFRPESEKKGGCFGKTHNLNIFGVFVRLRSRVRCDRIGRCRMVFPVRMVGGIDNGTKGRTKCLTTIIGTGRIC